MCVTYNSVRVCVCVSAGHRHSLCSGRLCRVTVHSAADGQLVKLMSGTYRIFGVPCFRVAVNSCRTISPAMRRQCHKPPAWQPLGSKATCLVVARGDVMVACFASLHGCCLQTAAAEVAACPLVDGFSLMTGGCCQQHRV